ncbi:MAG: hypothetical protein ACOX7F_00700 [Eubacteriales bacterium]|jgi:septal ring factor EnvC (AmiA/AmiB activator)
MEENKKSKKFLWIYTIALFTVCLILVFLSSLRHQQAMDFEEKYNQQIVLSEGVEKDLEQLKQQQKQTEEDMRALEEENQELQEQVNEYKVEVTNQNLLIMAQAAYFNGDEEKVLELLTQIPAEDLQEEELAVYNALKEQVGM